jgi:hypothetical protein
MRKLFILIGVLIALVAFNSAAAQNAVTVTLTQQNGSGVSGSATLTPMGNQTQVVINVTGEPAGASEPAHIHVGACPNPGSVKYPLTNVVNGSSTTTVNAPLSSITAGNMAINLHQSQQNISHYVSCGNIPVVATATTTPAAGGVPVGAAFALALALGGAGYVLRRKLA